MKFEDVIYASLGKRQRYKTQRMGIEVEYERHQGEIPAFDYWAWEHDNSLRNHGIEFISQPLTDAERPAALDELHEYLDGSGLEAHARCGVHVHMNVQFWTWKQLFTFLSTYALVEPYLFNQYAPGREDNHFCVPLTLNERLVDGLATDAAALRSGRAVGLELLRCSKYSALNLKPIQNLGTIEFRHLAGTLDVAVVEEWCRGLQRMRDFAEGQEGPVEVVQQYEDLGIEHLLERLEIHTCEIEEEWKEDAYFSASLLCGYEEPKWQDMEWNFNEEPIVVDAPPPNMPDLEMNAVQRQMIEDILNRNIRRD